MCWYLLFVFQRSSQDDSHRGMAGTSSRQATRPRVMAAARVESPVNSHRGISTRVTPSRTDSGLRPVRREKTKAVRHEASLAVTVPKTAVVFKPSNPKQPPLRVDHTQFESNKPQRMASSATRPASTTRTVATVIASADETMAFELAKVC
jgi:hypothetical protein